MVIIIYSDFFDSTFFLNLLSNLIHKIWLIKDILFQLWWRWHEFKKLRWLFFGIFKTGLFEWWRWRYMTDLFVAGHWFSWIKLSIIHLQELALCQGIEWNVDLFFTIVILGIIIDLIKIFYRHNLHYRHML